MRDVCSMCQQVSVKRSIWNWIFWVPITCGECDAAMAEEVKRIVEMEPLFLALRSQYYQEFKMREKKIEYRRYGKGYNEETCPVGRRVLLSKGYSKAQRMTGVIVSFEVSDLPKEGDEWLDRFGDHEGPAACIHIRLDS